MEQLNRRNTRQAARSMCVLQSSASACSLPGMHQPACRDKGSRPAARVDSHRRLPAPATRAHPLG